MQYQKPYNFTTNTLKAYLSAQPSSLSAFVISKTHISGQKLRGRQLNAKVCGSKSAIFRLLSFFLSFFVQPSIYQQRYLANGLRAHRHFTTKLILITARSFTTTQRLHSFKFTLLSKSHSQHSVAAVCCEGRYFLMLCACVQ